MNSLKPEKSIVGLHTSTHLKVGSQVLLRSSKIFYISGIIERPSVVSTKPDSSLPLHEECEWTIEPSPHRVLKLQVNMADIKNGEENI